MTKLYVASSWRNPVYPKVIDNLRMAGHECYDFRNPPSGTGFGWSQIDPNYKDWSLDQYTNALIHPVGQAGFHSDFDAMKWAEQFVLVLPSGRSAHVEAGWAAGAGKKVHVYIPKELPGSWEPELMYLCFTTICGNLDGLNYALHKHRPKAPFFKEEEMIGRKDVGGASYIETAADWKKEAITSLKEPHDWMPSTVGHGNKQCKRCLITDLEAAAIGSTGC